MKLQMKIFCKRCVLCFACVVGITSTHCALGQSPSSIPDRSHSASDQKVIALLGLARERVPTWAVEYNASIELSDGTRDSPYVRRVVAMGPDSFAHFGAHGSRQSSWKDDIEQQRLLIDRSTMVIERPFGRILFRADDNAQVTLPGTAGIEIWLAVLGVWSMAGMSPPRWDREIEPIFELAAKSPLYRIADDREVVNGEPCTKIESFGRDSLWLNLDKGGLLIKRNLYQSGPGKLSQSIVVTKAQEVLPGMWFPVEVEVTKFASSAQSESAKDFQVESIAHIKVESIAVNDKVDSHTFHFEPQDGSIQLDGRGAVVSILPGGVDYIDHLGDLMQRRGSEDVKGMQLWPLVLRAAEM